MDTQVAADIRANSELRVFKVFKALAVIRGRSDHKATAVGQECPVRIRPVVSAATQALADLADYQEEAVTQAKAATLEKAVTQEQPAPVVSADTREVMELLELTDLADTRAQVAILEWLADMPPLVIADIQDCLAILAEVGTQA